MNIWNLLFKKKNDKKEQYRKEGFELEQQEKYEEAYLKYEEAARMDDIPSIVHIAKMYLSGNFRPVETSNLAELMLQGNPIFPWNQVRKMHPDYERGLAWLIKAADLGDGFSCELAGNMYAQGLGCKADMEKAVYYLKKALSNGQKSARKYLCLYCPDGRNLSDEAYEDCLTEFVKAADAGDDKAYELYATLKSGTQRQLARLGHILISAQNIHKTGYELFTFSVSPSGIPLLPVVSKRGSWCTFLRFNLDAWTEKYPLIAVSSDIGVSCLLRNFHHARIVGTAVYKSPASGWLREEKHAVLLQLGVDDTLDPGVMKKVADSFQLSEEEYLGDSIAFLVEDGEKEYSFEVAGIQGNRVEVLWRYTIGGTDHIQKYFEPELISIEYTDSQALSDSGKAQEDQERNSEDREKDEDAVNNNLTELIYILDMSGSMQKLAKDTIGGYNSLLNEQRKLSEKNPELKANVTTVLFDDRYILLHDRMDIRKVPEITDKEYVPVGMTAMLDAIGRTLASIGQTLATAPEEEKPGLVSVTIITDGYENASKEYNWATVQQMIRKKREKYSWVFSFIGANIDVEKTSADLGIDHRMSRKFTASHDGTASVFGSVTRGTTAMRSMAQAPHSSREEALADALDDIE